MVRELDIGSHVDRHRGRVPIGRLERVVAVERYAHGHHRALRVHIESHSRLGRGRGDRRRDANEAPFVASGRHGRGDERSTECASQAPAVIEIAETSAVESDFSASRAWPASRVDSRDSHALWQVVLEDDSVAGPLVQLSIDGQFHRAAIEDRIRPAWRGATEKGRPVDERCGHSHLIALVELTPCAAEVSHPRARDAQACHLHSVHHLARDAARSGPS